MCIGWFIVCQQLSVAGKLVATLEPQTSTWLRYSNWGFIVTESAQTCSMCKKTHWSGKNKQINKQKKTKKRNKTKTNNNNQNMHEMINYWSITLSGFDHRPKCKDTFFGIVQKKGACTICALAMGIGVPTLQANGSSILIYILSCWHFHFVLSSLGLFQRERPNEKWHTVEVS